jgi:hypothetical protein
MSDSETRYSRQHARLCNIVIGQMGMRPYFDQRDKPYWVTFKIFEVEGSGHVTASIEKLERMSNDEIAASVWAKLRLPRMDSSHACRVK